MQAHFAKAVFLSLFVAKANSSIDFVLITMMKKIYRKKYSTGTLNDKNNKAKHNMTYQTYNNKYNP